MRVGRPLPIRTRLTVWYTAVLLAILLVISGSSYSLLRWSLRQDLDTSLLTVARALGDAGVPAGRAPEEALRDLLGPELSDKFFQFTDPSGQPGSRSAELPTRLLPLSPTARDNAARGVPTFETVELARSDVVRLLTMPIMRDGHVTQVVQVGMSLHRARQALRRYLETLLVLIPLGLALAAVGGALIARVALSPVDEMSRSARRITAEDLSLRLARRGAGDELDHLADTLNSMLARLEEAFAQARRFAADAAHELRTPLTALRGEIEVALRAARSPEEYRRVLRSSLEEVERLARLAEDLLLLSRATTGPEAPKARVDLEPILLDVLDVGARLAHGSGVAVHLTETTPATIRGDAVAIRRALLNLVENAVKYTPAGGRVDLSLARVDGSAALAVQDTGPGIPPADAERVFQPFVRLDAARARDTGGAGLGLAIARSVVLAHGGTLALESAPGAGSRFSIRLPLA